MGLEVWVVKPGILVRDKLGIILDARCTVTLIKGNENNIIVDTGVSGEGPKIEQGLSLYGFKPSDIDIVVNTHLHGDHCGNNEMFANACFIVHEREFGKRLERKNRLKIIKGDHELERGINLISTPGHTYGSISVWVKHATGVLSENTPKAYVVAGDALPIIDNYRKWVPPGINVDPQIALDSMDRITTMGDIIIPGHDSPFILSNTLQSKIPHRKRIH